MKRIVCVAVVLLMCMSAFAGVAEERFALRCGIYFGDTKNEVKEKETLAIKSETDYEIVTESGKLAGENVESVSYRFDDKGQLVSVLWNVCNSRNDIFPPMIFESLSESLSAKYGTPDSSDTDTFFLIKGAAIDDMLNLAEESTAFALSLMLGKAGPMMQNEWQIESSNNENVKIDLLLYQVDETDYRLRLSYDVYTDEQLEMLHKENRKSLDDI